MQGNLYIFKKLNSFWKCHCASEALIIVHRWRVKLWQVMTTRKCSSLEPPELSFGQTEWDWTLKNAVMVQMEHLVMACVPKGRITLTSITTPTKSSVLESTLSTEWSHGCAKSCSSCTMGEFIAQLSVRTWSWHCIIWSDCHSEPCGFRGSGYNRVPRELNGF